MNGAESLIRTLVGAGVDVCFANPGTSEMHLVQAIDGVEEMRGVLCLFEGVCTGAADGYARLTGRPAVTLLHLGPGLGNGIANLHNARRASTPLINLIGNHALYHVEFDAPLTSDIDTLAKNVSSWIKSDSTATSLSTDAMQALRSSLHAKPGSAGQISTMIIPADACWSEASNIASQLNAPSRETVASQQIDQVAATIDSQSLILLDKQGLELAGRFAAARIAKKLGCRVAMSTFPARVDGGPGTPVIERLPYFPEHVLASLEGVSQIILAGAEPPVSFFAYPETASLLVPKGCQVIDLAKGHQDVVNALSQLESLLGASEIAPDCYQYEPLELPQGALTTMNVARILAAKMPANSIFCGDSGGGGAVFEPAQRSASHIWLNLTGGSIGQGGPVAIGAAIAAPEAQVFALLGDGASMYTNQAFWTQARESLNVTTVIFNNQRYGILETEYKRLGVNEIGDRAGSLFSLSGPEIDFVSLAGSMGVPGCRADSCESFSAALSRSLEQSGPFLIEAMV
ncbi:MAG: acetolactate synthase large subunit [Gammaproteobacteria bacterium]|nr:acetolactate synthase large subunit [Gammaproteobacteria bacterium]